MSNVIGFLEAVGQDSELRYANSEQFELALARSNLDSQVSAAISHRAEARLKTLLGSNTIVCSMIFVPEEPGKEEDEEPAEPSKDEVQALSANRVA